ncbi:MAG: shikimate kinase [Planctomycetia bacterium]
MPRITLIGYRGCGKSTVAELLAARLRCGWQDADAVLEEEVGCTIADLVRSRGEPFFRDVEAGLLAGRLLSYDGVLATGGGVVLRPANRILLRQAYRPVVWLTAPVDVVRARLAADPSTAARRPALSGSDPMEEISAAIATREPLYRESADHVIDTSRAGPGAIAEAIDAWLKREWSS